MSLEGACVTSDKLPEVISLASTLVGADDKFENENNLCELERIEVTGPL